ncbi:IS30 family transposase [Ensifer sp. ENS06]|uniref:IS30 family transposase n=1 Tax=Ensifer sp. ENS06 TaxID=2769276 RepID=UPI0017800B83|nr:IS30 family transposase [Ensifer sp. ENS06]MBD9624764.1 IS30 family transposase [Ensifer sp. ENS06]
MSRRYSQLNLADRRRLFHFVERKLPIKEMARELGRHRSTIYREIRRNTFRDRELPDYSGYFPTVADDIRKERRQRLRKLVRHPQLRELVIEQLKALWSPQQIAGRLLADGVSAVRVCTETIYRFIYGKDDQALELYQHLSEGRRKRRPRGSRKPRDGTFPADCRISQRPDFIGDRSQFGHWEGDLLIFQRDLGNANVTSLIERKSRYTVMIKNQSRHSRPIMDNIIETFSPLPAFARQSFTFDRGTEFAGFGALEDGIGARSWFCDPSAPWQKGAVENINKRIRRYMPGDTDLAGVSQRKLIQLARHLNDQPRKCLDYRTPAEVFRAHLQEGG